MVRHSRSQTSNETKFKDEKSKHYYSEGIERLKYLQKNNNLYTNIHKVNLDVELYACSVLPEKKSS